MSALTKTVVAVFTALLVGGVAYVAAAPGGQSNAAPAAADVRGPCDEPEHATDPRCSGVQAPEDNHARHEDRHGVADDPAEDVNDDNGVADENEPEDVNEEGPGEAEDHSNRGPGSLNSGPGNARDRGDDGMVEDHSGPGPDGSGSGDSSSGDSGSDHSGSGDSGSGGSGRG